jgi:hypothetical protein
MRAAAGGRRRDDVRLALHVGLQVCFIPLRNAYSDPSSREVKRGQRVSLFHIRFSIFCFQFLRGEK